MCIYIYVYIYMYMYIYTCTHVHIYICKCMYTYLYMYVPIRFFLNTLSYCGMYISLVKVTTTMHGILYTNKVEGFTSGTINLKTQSSNKFMKCAPLVSYAHCVALCCFVERVIQFSAPPPLLFCPHSNKTPPCRNRTGRGVP